MMVTPVSSSPASIARSIGAAPRQRGSSEGWTLSISCCERSGSFKSAPNAQMQTTSGSARAMRARACSSFTFSGWNSSIASRPAASATGGCPSFRPRPRGRSGRVTTSTGRCADSARRSSTVTANSEVPR
jgi:hypothetical protein